MFLIANEASGLMFGLIFIILSDRSLREPTIASKSFLVFRDKVSVLSVRPENARDDNFPRRWALYEVMAERSWIEVINNNATIDDAVAGIYANILLHLIVYWHPDF